MSLNPTPLPRLLYVEDDAQIAGMTSDVLREAYDVVHLADGRLALDRALAERFDLMVIDRRLPGLDGIALVEAIRTARITTPVLLLTALGAVADRVDGLDAGANDYLVKPFDFDELLARLRALVRGHRVEGRRRSLADWAFLPDASVAYGPGGERVALTPTETKLLSLLAESPEHVFTRGEILHAVFESNDALSSVDTYVHYVRRKTAPDVVETVRGRGYRAGAAR
ncbi:MAG: two-component system response regulator [Microbacterium sp. SCN 70-27]|uniref:response regulator transcription factor n=1 Tax=unclassified Microbacterium TaxID=2609290 RepID=UPI00086C54D0|nr:MULTISPECIES: response regulator transcription factor [unclassified Microbacterium]MBN9223989.1 response regulator transcription factor [Microbacterium sp.]ODT26904.1 MAG: two-component system response regulator [Microbacterium sp. SCN 70-27]